MQIRNFIGLFVICKAITYLLLNEPKVQRQAQVNDIIVVLEMQLTIPAALEGFVQIIHRDHTQNATSSLQKCLHGPFKSGREAQGMQRLEGSESEKGPKSKQLFRAERNTGKQICTWWGTGDFRNVVMRGEQREETVERNVRFGWGKMKGFATRRNIVK